MTGFTSHTGCNYIKLTLYKMNEMDKVLDEVTRLRSYHTQITTMLTAS